MRWRTMSFSTRPSRACAVRSTLSAAREVMELTQPCLQIPGIPCGSTSRARDSAYRSTASNCLRSRTQHSPTPARWVCGPRPTASRCLTKLSMAKRSDSTNGRKHYDFMRRKHLVEVARERDRDGDQQKGWGVSHSPKY